MEFIIWKTARDREFLHEGKAVSPPAEWIFVPSGDPGLTRKLKIDGKYWLLVHKRRNRIEALGVWTDRAKVSAARAALEQQRSSPEYQKRMASAKRARERKQQLYETEFNKAVKLYLDFAPRYAAMAEVMAAAVTAHAIPAGSGTVARTEMIPLPKRAEAAVIAWMRHNTTAYDTMIIPNMKGERRAIRKMLADRSRALLDVYRAGRDILTNCPLYAVLQKLC